jgi:peptide chain release factor 1
MYEGYAAERGWQSRELHANENNRGGYRNVLLEIRGAGAYGRLKHEAGVHRLVRISPYDSAARRHTSFCSVWVYPVVDDNIEIEVQDKDIRIDTYRSSGAGGQHVNKTDSAVRMTHIPTGVVVACQSERSQLKNRALAMSVMRSRLYQAQQEKLAKERDDARSSQVGTADRSEKIRTYNFPQDRITDHRMNLNFSNIPAVMEGEFGDIVEAMQKWEEDEALKQL